MCRRLLLLCSLSLLLGQGCSDARSPRIDAIVPPSAGGGEIVHVVGDGFDAVALQVSFGGRAARLLQRQARRAIVEVPAGLAGLVPVVVLADGDVSVAFDFWVNDAPAADGGGAP